MGETGCKRPGLWRSGLPCGRPRGGCAPPWRAGSPQQCPDASSSHRLSTVRGFGLVFLSGIRQSAQQLSNKCSFNKRGFSALWWAWALTPTLHLQTENMTWDRGIQQALTKCTWPFLAFPSQPSKQFLFKSGTVSPGSHCPPPSAPTRKIVFFVSRVFVFPLREPFFRLPFLWVLF